MHGFEEGKEGFITYVVLANPQPSLQWRVDTKHLIEGGGDAEYEVMIAAPLEMSRYKATLRILRVSSSDFNKDFYLTARNELGTQIYTIRISTHEPETTGKVN
ncbi:hypothetical protein B566_EDAN015418 [Ephemera danica]|nr:hypothetical protein B566_EDAN015418 [Ephemera danica]